MLGPELLVRLHRRIENRRAKAWGIGLMRRLGMRYLVVRMDTTNLCNLRCRMCYYSATRPRGRQEMDEELFAKIAREMLPATRFLYLSCQTEPLMNPRFARFLELTGRCGVPFTSFCTNGQLMNDAVAQASVAAGLSEIIFSIDGATAATYEYIRRGARWDKLLAGLESVRSAKAAAGSRLPAVRINFTCMERNIAELPAMVGFAESVGASGVHVRHLFAFSAEASGMDYRQQVAYMGQFRRLAREARDEAAQRGVSLFLPSIPQDGGAAASHEQQSPAVAGPRQPPARERNPCCVLPWYSVIITPQGDWRLCSAYRSMGNLRRQSFDDIYFSPRLRQLRRDLLARASGACSWSCGEEAYDAPDGEAADEPAADQPPARERSEQV
jgi:MoaA/NifB/PqqE/SkfB family radical SAM enzyme